ncbi:bifunctional acetate--CoA ligase family protein/GNAT family N-acetyltransferase [Wenzhouxiangella sp. XN79A]|uniref:bifunctional acetate--CoA ligase family protein/GNAT family N-acetyltransferase n=1 Tax=Wenzhouxiangella sp. XN79A TaxID=2724193 RepID=UPI00144AC3B4|nr:bifunctional acetate--CoA ligase family protein/GNAT family N-acetyltransferase [Wenzhouxiangella sp. XN79A]NKI35174.1 bifunctional acetate--CoA ligase family protein/GNAT family N-acetyltransferase [Wenzhouxiangella sp. XN79A]
MSVRHLDSLFRPRSIAVIGASDREGSVGRAVLANLIGGGFQGALYAVNLRHDHVQGLPVHRRLDRLPEVPELIVVCTPAAVIPELIDRAGGLGVRAAVILSAGFAEAGEDLEEQLLAAAGRHGLRLLGPNSVGIILPHHAVNASFAPNTAEPGHVAFVTQSGALATAALEWAGERDIGFSCFVSLGNCLDIDIGDVIDWLGNDPKTRAILLYMESLAEGRKFMSATRAAARNKPLVIVKSGRAPEGARAAASHTGALAGSDEVFDAAIARAGALRVDGLEDLFGMAEVLSRPRPAACERLVILTNGGGPGILATDAWVRSGGQLARLEERTLAALHERLPAHWSRNNPVDIIGDAPPERYLDALEPLLEDAGVDAVLLVHAPTSMADSESVAEQVVTFLDRRRAPGGAPERSVFGCWLGGESARAAASVFARADRPGFTEIEDAVKALRHLCAYRSNQAALIETPGPGPSDPPADPDAVRALLEPARAAGRRWLSEHEAKRVLAAYGIPVVETRIAHGPDEAAEQAEAIGFPVAVKVLSSDITHKSDVGGVVLDLESPAAAREAAQAIARRVEARSDARLEGFTVQAMHNTTGRHELICGAHSDDIFGPVVLFGQGGTAVEVVDDTALGLVPLNMALARRQIERTRVARLLAGYRHHPPARIERICEVLVRVSRLIADIDIIDSLDINPLLAGPESVIALDARIAVRPAGAGPRPRPSIAPYPGHLAEQIDFDGRSIELRPIRPEDEPAHAEFFRSLSDEDVRFRFFGVIREPSHTQLARFTQIDYDREMAFIARETDGERRTLGVVRIAIDAQRQRAEFAVVVRSAIKGRGLGRILLQKLIAYCRTLGLATVIGQVLIGNDRMLTLAREFGFHIGPPADGLHEVVLDLASTRPGPSS